MILWLVRALDCMRCEDQRVATRKHPEDHLLRRRVDDQRNGMNPKNNRHFRAVRQLRDDVWLQVACNDYIELLALEQPPQTAYRADVSLVTQRRWIDSHFAKRVNHVRLRRDTRCNFGTRAMRVAIAAEI